MPKTKKTATPDTVKPVKAPKVEKVAKADNPPKAAPAVSTLKITRKPPAAKSAPAAKPAAAAKPSSELRVFQIFNSESQKQQLDKHFVPLNNIGAKDPLQEIAVLRKLYKSEHVAGLKYWGAVSARFEEQMGLNGKTLMAYILQNPDYDVYFCNPYAELEALYQNLWVQGAVAHPEFLKICDVTFRGVGMDPKVLSRPMPSTLFATANIFVATPKFWDAYMAYVEDFLVKAEKLPPKLKQMLLSPNTGPDGAKRSASSYLHSILERLFSEFLVANIGKFKALKVKSPAMEKRQTVYHNNLRTLKDAAIVGKSDWMLDCWSNYRKVLMGSIHGKPWMEKHLPLLNYLSADYIELKS